jgi:hypothetical protein
MRCSRSAARLIAQWAKRIRSNLRVSGTTHNTTGRVVGYSESGIQPKRSSDTRTIFEYDSTSSGAFDYLRAAKELMDDLDEEFQTRRPVHSTTSEP